MCQAHFDGVGFMRRVTRLQRVQSALADASGSAKAMHQPFPDANTARLVPSFLEGKQLVASRKFLAYNRLMCGSEM
jgi:hypothetical protein